MALIFDQLGLVLFVFLLDLQYDTLADVVGVADLVDFIVAETLKLLRLV